MKSPWALAAFVLAALAGSAWAAEETPRHRFPLWDEGVPFPRRESLSYPQGATDVMVHRAGADGYDFLHDAAIVQHKGTLLAAWYNCPRGEMVGESLIRGRRSSDGGRTWSGVEVIAGDRKKQGILYVPVALASHGGTLYAFVANMKGGPDLVHDCEVFVLDDKTNAWTSRGFIAGPFLPNCAPQRLADGNFIMAGRMADQRGQKPTIPAVAISRGENLAEPWSLVRLLPAGKLENGKRMHCPETTALVEGHEITALVRHENGCSLAFFSHDDGRTWSGPREHNFPMEASKIYAGLLSTGQRYGLCNLPCGARRALLVIAVSRPGQTALSKMWKIRDGYSPSLQSGPEWSYPCAIEFDGKLWVVYTSEKHHCVLTAIPVGSLAVDAAAPPARYRRIEAGWRIATDPQNAGRREGWFRRIRDEARPAPVPGTIQQVFPGYHGVAWFWSEFEGLPRDPAGSKCFVRFGSVDYHAEVWLNGQRLGDHEGADSPFELDAGAALRPDGKNLLAVRVVNPGRERIDGFQITEVPHSFKESDHFVFGESANSGGILSPVELRMRPPIRVTDLFCPSDPATGKVTLRIAIQSDAREGVPCRLSGSVDLHDSGHTVAQCAGSVDVSVRPGPSEFRLPLVVPQPRLWSPREPNLYGASVRLEAKVAGAAVVDDCRQQFGFRDFRVGSDGYFRLNGRRLFLNSCHTTNNFPVAIGVAHKPEFWTRDLLYAKAMGFDMVRFLGGPPVSEQLHFCDEIGLMVYAESRASWRLRDSPWTAERFDQSLTQMILGCRSHASVTVWGLLNETRDRPVFRHAVGSLPLVRSLDESRLVLLNSGRFDFAPGIGSLCNPGGSTWEFLWGNESADTAGAKASGTAKDSVGDVHRYMPVPHTPADIAMLRTLGGRDRPVFLSEYGVGSLVNCVRLIRLHQQDGSPPDLEDFAAYRAVSERLAADLKRFDMETLFTFPGDLFRESERLHAKHRIIAYNAIRSNPKLCGYNLTGMIDQPAGEGLITEWRELKLGIMDAMNDCLAPLRWCLFVEPMHVYAGRPFRVEAVMANDGVLGPGKYPARFRIRGPEGIVWEKGGSLVVPAADSPDQIPLAIPVLAEEVTITGPAGVYTFAAELEGGAPRGERLDFHLSRAEDLVKMHHAVAVLGIPESTQAWLAAHGVECRPPDAPSARNQGNSVVLVGYSPGPPDRVGIWRELARRMAQGSVVVFLEPSAFADGADSTRWLPLKQKGQCRRARNAIYHREDVAKRHPIFEGLPAGGVLDWYYYLQLIPQLVFDGQATADDTAAVALAPAGAEFTKDYTSGLIAGSYRFGAGRLVLSTFRILENLDRNPAADRMLLNLVRYAGNLVSATVAPLPPDFEEHLRAIGYEQGRP